MLRKSNSNLSIEFLKCLKSSDSILGLCNANQFIKWNNGKLKFIYKKQKGTKVMFNFSMKMYDDDGKSPSIFTERSLLNNIDNSPKYNE